MTKFYVESHDSAGTHSSWFTDAPTAPDVIAAYLALPRFQQPGRKHVEYIGVWAHLNARQSGWAPIVDGIFAFPGRVG